MDDSFPAIDLSTGGTMPEGDRYYKVLITPELIDSLMTRDADGHLVTWEASKPDSDGFVDLIFTVHYDDVLPDGVVERLKQKWEVEHRGFGG